ncbi:MAG TPA: response regulator [Minicystis sp.]|nr:response regulator [Minicystis sp.]
MRRSILVVDDDGDLRSSISTVLAEAGYAIDEAPNGADALTRVAAAAPDLILLDLMMPEGSGWEVLERLRRDASRVPVIVISAYASSLPTGARALLRKPIHRDDLLASVREHITSS